MILTAQIKTNPIKIKQILLPPVNVPDREIITQIKNGNNEAYGSIMRRYNQRMFRIARSIVTDDAAAMDIVQEAHIKAYTKLNEFNGLTGFFPWLATITRNEAFMYLRKYKREVSMSDDVIQLFEQAEPNNKINTQLGGQSELPDATLESAQLKKLMVKYIDKLPNDFRIVFVLRAIEQLSVKETAEILNIKEETVKTRYFRAKRILRGQIQGYLDTVGMQVYEFGEHHCDNVIFNVMSFIKKSSS